MTSSQLQEESVTSGLWSPDKGAVDFAAAFGVDPPAEFGCTDRKKHRQTGSDLLINSADPGILLKHHRVPTGQTLCWSLGLNLQDLERSNFLPFQAWNWGTPFLQILFRYQFFSNMHVVTGQQRLQTPPTLYTCTHVLIVSCIYSWRCFFKFCFRVVFYSRYVWNIKKHGNWKQSSATDNRKSRDCSVVCWFSRSSLVHGHALPHPLRLQTLHVFWPRGHRRVHVHSLHRRQTSPSVQISRESARAHVRPVTKRRGLISADEKYGG